MALDLFFVPRKPAFEQLRSPDFQPTAAMVRARRKLVTELIADFPGTRLEGSAQGGTLVDFPRGDLTLGPGYLHWSLHGVTDEAPVHEIVAWFLKNGHVCEDPQEAGFANRELESGSVRSTLDSYDELVGAQFVGLRLQREWGFGIGLDWLLADGSAACLEFFFGHCRLPDIGQMVEQRVAGVHLERGRPELLEYDTLRVIFEGNAELILERAIYRRSTITRAPARSGG